MNEIVYTNIKKVFVRVLKLNCFLDVGRLVMLKSQLPPQLFIEKFLIHNKIHFTKLLKQKLNELIDRSFFFPFIIIGKNK